MTPDTVGWIASMTKAITTAAAMQLVEQGRLELDAPASEVAPGLGDTAVLEGFDGDGNPRTPSPAPSDHIAPSPYPHVRVRLRHLERVDGPIPGGNRHPRHHRMQGCLPHDTARLRPGASAGTTGSASTGRGRWSRRVSGQRLGEYLRDHLLGPLGMDDTAFRITDAMRARLAKIHMRGEDGSLAPQMELEIPQDPEFEMGGGGLYGTVGDYLRFIRMILNRGRANGEQLLAPGADGGRDVPQPDR